MLPLLGPLIGGVFDIGKQYFSNKAVKTQLMATYINFPDYSTQNQINIECLLQIKF